MKIIENVGYLNRLFLYGVFCTLFPLVGTSCSTTKNLIDANDIDYIKFWYMPKWIETPNAIRDCADIVYDTCVTKDSVIMDRKIIREYVKAVNNNGSAAEIKLMLANVEPDVEGLQAAIEKASAVTNNNYTEATWNALQAKIAEAEELAAAEDPDANEVEIMKV